MLDKLKSLFRRQPKPEPEPLILEPLPRIMVRAVGFCRTEGCQDFNKGRFVFSPHADPIHVCSYCHARGWVVKEEWSTKYAGNMDFYQVRLEYGFKPSLIPEVHEGTWTGIAVVTDESLPATHNVYYMKSPLITTQDRALKVAESVLSGLLRNPERIILENPGSRPPETKINFDVPLGDVKAQLWELEHTLRDSRLSREYETK